MLKGFDNKRYFLNTAFHSKIELVDIHKGGKPYAN